MTSFPIDVLVPTCDRAAALAVTLTALGAQTMGLLRIVISDQSVRADACVSAEVQAVMRYLCARGHLVERLRRMPLRGMAERRAFLFAQVSAQYCLFLDDDVMVEPDLVARLHRATRVFRCGFVGSAVDGLSYLGKRVCLNEGSWSRPRYMRCRRSPRAWRRGPIAAST